MTSDCQNMNKMSNGQKLSVVENNYSSPPGMRMTMGMGGGDVGNSNITEEDELIGDVRKIEISGNGSRRSSSNGGQQQLSSSRRQGVENEADEYDSLSPMTIRRKSTHNNIFGESSNSSGGGGKLGGKVYHMSSDIFGIGSIVDRTGQHVGSPGNRPVRRRDCQAFNEMQHQFHEQQHQHETPTPSGRVMAAGDSKSDARVNDVNGTKNYPSHHNGSFSSPPPETVIMDRKSNARENGCNPVTGHGYAEGDVTKSQRRQYPRGRSQSLW